MNLISIKEYFEKHNIASPVEIAAHFKVKPLDIECYLTYWQHRGNLIVCNQSCASGCNLCFKHNNVCYQWQEQPSTTRLD